MLAGVRELAARVRERAEVTPGLDPEIDVPGSRVARRHEVDGLVSCQRRMCSAWLPRYAPGWK
jgi:hypothetical protein